MRICIVSSVGGHLAEVKFLKASYEKYEHFYVLNDVLTLSEDMKGKTWFMAHSERDLKFFLNLWEAFVICRRERPDVILSTGAGPVVPMAIVGRLFFGCEVIFVETFTRINKPSLTGRIMYYLAHRFFYQWEELGRYFPKGTCGGPLL